MAGPELPPTPASSSELKGKDGSAFSPLQISFELPPPAVVGVESTSFTTSKKLTITTSPHPTLPITPTMPASEVVKTCRRSSATQALSKDPFTLPPPPVRSRKIIQMKPREKHPQVAEGPSEPKKNVGKPLCTSRRKHASSTSAAGRKVARKTAHSLIERKRRSKMNEEFANLKGMVPACTGEMHKLAILQASIDYVRYLEECVATLKAEKRCGTSRLAGENCRTQSEDFNSPKQPSNLENTHEDVDMEGTGEMSDEQTSPASTFPRPQSSPLFLAASSYQYSQSTSTIPGDRQQDSHHASSTLSMTSPVGGPGACGHPRSKAPILSTLASPTLEAQRDLDREATAALLMLNSDCRKFDSKSGGRGMSVSDLLSG